MFLQELADAIRDRVDPELVPADSSGLFRIYAVLGLAKGAAVTEADVHNAWVAWTMGIDPTHEDLRPFDRLDAATAMMDRPYREAIRDVMTTHEESSNV